jgi:hypothetical protein
MKSVDGGGPVLSRAKIVLIFKGSGWLGGNPRINDAQTVLQAALASPYASHMKQYRDIRRPQIVDTLTDTSDVGGLGPDPRGFLTGDVWVVSDADMQSVVRGALQSRPPRDDEQIYYMVLFSNNVIPVLSDKGLLNAEGYHSRLEDQGRSITYGVVLNNASNTLENIWRSVGSLPAVFGHEVVEACTDPGPTPGFSLDNGEELADLGQAKVVPVPGLQQSISIAAYWSELMGGPVVPTAYSMRVFLGLSHAQSGFVSGAFGRSQTVRSEVLAAFNS